MFEPGPAPRAFSLAPGQDFPAALAAGLRQTLSPMARPGNTRLVWKVRPIPSAAISSGRRPSSRVPPKAMLPSAGRAKPVTAWISVDFPAPFGPTMPTNSPGSTVRLTASTAFSPPKATLTRSSTRPADFSVMSNISALPRCPAAGTAA
nr:hypothetical protein [Mangrovicoccus ximenensis]